MNTQAAGSRIAGQDQGGEQPGSSGESQPGGGSEPLHEQLRRRLFEERKSREGRESSGDTEEQPERGKARTEPASEGHEDDDQEYEADDPNAELDDPESNPGTDENPDEEELDDPDDGEELDEGSEPEALTVDDRQYTADDIRQLETRTRELDADYRRKTQVMSRQRQEYAAHGEELQEVSGFFQKLAEANLRQLENIDPNSLSQEEFAVWKNQLAHAKDGRNQLLQSIDNVKKRVNENRNKMLDHQAKESSEILRGVDPRWGNDFYAKIRDFAVESGRFSPEEFADVTDWRTMEGLIALYDRAEAQKRAKSKKDQRSETREPPTKRRRRRARQPRNTQGQFQTAQKAVAESTNAKADGSLRNYFQERLAKERGRR